MSVIVPNGDKWLDPDLLANMGLLLFGHNLHSLSPEEHLQEKPVISEF
jgi:hypothetical protein